MLDLRLIGLVKSINSFYYTYMIAVVYTKMIQYLRLWSRFYDFDDYFMTKIKKKYIQYV